MHEIATLKMSVHGGKAVLTQKRRSSAYDRAQKAPIRIGYLASGAAASRSSAAQVDAINQGLRDNGLIAGRDYVLEARFAAGNHVRFRLALMH